MLWPGVVNSGTTSTFFNSKIAVCTARAVDPQAGDTKYPSPGVTITTNRLSQFLSISTKLGSPLFEQVAVAT